MRKFTLLFFAAMMAFVSCKDKGGDPKPEEIEDSTEIEVPPPAEANTLPRQIVLRSNRQVESYKITYKSGNKIDKITKSNEEVQTYHYNGQGLIERIDYSGFGDRGSIAYTYNGTVLIRSEIIQSDIVTGKIEYAYPSDGKVTYTELSLENGRWKTEPPVTLEYDSKGNLIRGSQGSTQLTITNDDKNSPFVNVAGWSKIHLIAGVSGENVDIDIFGRRNNPTNTKMTESQSMNRKFIYEFTDTENPKFPTKVTGKEGNETVFTAEICYSGNCNLSTDPVDPNNPGDESNPENLTLPETIVMTFKGEERTYTITYQGDARNIDKISRSGVVETYVYDVNNRIQKIYRGSENDGNYSLYTYDGNGRLIKEEVHRPGNPVEVNEFNYSGTKPVMSMNGDADIEFIQDSNGNITAVALSVPGLPNAGSVSLTFDDKNAPFKNVAGWGKVRYLAGLPLGENVWFEDIMGGGNNPLKLTGNFMGQAADITYVYEFKDNKNPKFPTKITGTKKVGSEPEETFDATITYK